METNENRPEFYLVTTDHLETAIWFKDDADYKMGMNLVAVLCAVLHVDMLGFILMSNHVHFVLSCTRKDAQFFINEFKRRYSIYMRNKYGVKEMLRENSVDIQPLNIGDESLERALAYVQMNCVAANICLQPSDYPWGTGPAFFRTTFLKGKRLSEVSIRKQYQLFHTRLKLPNEYIVSDDGYIIPASYCNVRFVESLFRTPKRMTFFLLNSSKAKARLNAESIIPAFKDQVIVSAIADLCVTLFRKRSIDDLIDLQRKELLKQLRFRFSANINQLCRVTGLSYEEAARLLDGV